MKKLLSLLFISSFLIVFNSCQSELTEVKEDVANRDDFKSMTSLEKEINDYDNNMQKIA